MFQGSPNESIRNRIPFAFEPGELDAVLLTHAHLDHCGLLPVLVKDGYRGRIHATAGTIELATLVLLDSGKLHEEFAKRDARWEKRHPDEIGCRRSSPGRRSTRPRSSLRTAGEGEEPTTDGVDRRRTRDQHAADVAARPRGRAPGAAGRSSTSTSTRRCTPPRTPSARSPSSSRSATARRSRSRRGSTRPSWTPATSSARRSSVCGSLNRRAARSVSSSARATSAGPARRSCATRPRWPRPTTSSSNRRTAAASTSRRRRRSASSPRPSGWSPTRAACCSSRHSRSGAPRRSSGSSIA